MGEKRINKKSVRGISAVIIVIIIVIAAVVVGVGVYLATRSSGTGSSNSATPSPKPSSSAAATASPTSTGKIATATSYEFNETGTASNGTVLDTLYYATKNLGTTNVDLYEVATTPSSGTLIYIINGGEQKAWAYANGQWTDISTEYASIQPTVQSTAGLYVNMLEGWGGSGSFTYTIPSGQQNAGDKATFTNIKINPSLPDSLFQGPS
ncbi:MAG TPA: hypothetical protein VJY36_07120 [Candidatus Bathyarchaeia archaeon]|nr:hypothetical protein [Candidatus Bathyarchaeia archaeon]